MVRREEADPFVPTTRQIDPGTTFAIRLAVPTYQPEISVPRTMSHGRQVGEGHSPKSIEVDTGGMFQHRGADALRSSLLVLGVVVQEHH